MSNRSSATLLTDRLWTWISSISTGLSFSSGIGLAENCSCRVVMGSQSPGSISLRSVFTQRIRDPAVACHLPFPQNQSVIAVEPDPIGQIAGVESGLKDRVEASLEDHAGRAVHDLGLSARGDMSDP